MLKEGCEDVVSAISYDNVNKNHWPCPQSFSTHKRVNWEVGP